MKTRWMMVLMLLAFGAADASAERMPIPRALIEAAVARVVPGVRAQAVEVLAQASATEASPRLTVDQVKFDTSRGWMQARVRCERSEVCVPFYVAAEMPRGEVAAPVPARAGRVTPVMWLVRAGKPAMLVATGERMRLTMPVRCLENGAQGERVHVRGAGGAVYAAEVVGPGELRAEWGR